MNDSFTEVEYSVDLSREEYVRSQEILAGRAGGMARGMRFISLFMLAACVIMGILDFWYSNGIDWSLISLLVLLIGSELWMMLTMPAQLRRRSEAAYDSTVYGGYVFSGTVTVENDAIRKRTATATTVIPYAQCRVYAETADMMIFCGMDGKSIVIPARFLNERTAEATRQAALKNVPLPRQMLMGKLVPCLTEGETVTAPDSATSDEVLLTVEVEYTDNEIVGIAAESAVERFAASLPNKCILMTMLASVGYFMFEIKPLPLFLSALLIAFLASVIKARIRMRRTITHTERRVCKLRVEFTDSYLLLIGKADGMRPMRLPWSHVTRAVNCRDTVEIYTGKDRQLSIPKRCITDFEELREIVDNHV